MHATLGLWWWLGVGCLTLSCTPGELNEDQQDYLRKELERRYPRTENPTEDADSGVTPTQPSAEPDPTTEPTPDPTTEPTENPTTEPTVAPQPNSEVPDCAVEVFTTTCAGAACHYDSTFRFPPDFQMGDIFTTLTTGTTGCADVASNLFVDLENPEDSYLLVKVRGQQPTGCGSPMPPESDTLSAAQLSCLEDWIESL